MHQEWSLRIFMINATTIIFTKNTENSKNLGMLQMELKYKKHKREDYRESAIIKGKNFNGN